MDRKELLRSVRRLEIKTRRLTDNIFAGEYHSAFKGRGMSFAEVREYQAGDDVRDIDWNVTARMNRPYIKVFEEERELTLMLLIDISESQSFGTTLRDGRQLAAEIAATLAFSAMQNNDQIGVIFFSDRIEKFIPPRKGRKHILYIIRELLSLKPEGKRTDIGLALEYFMRVSTKRTISFLISDFYDNGDYTRPLTVAARKHDFIALRLFDRLMTTLPNVGLIKIKDPETGHEQVVDTSSAVVRKRYAQDRHEKDERLHRLLTRSGVDHTEIATDADYVKPLINLFAGR